MLRPQGRRGEVLAELHTDFPGRFEERRNLWGLAPDGHRSELHLEEHWFHKGGVVLKFGGVDSISDAERLAGFEIQVAREQRSRLETGAVWVSEIVGCQIWLEQGERLLGSVTEVQFGAGEAPLLVVKLPEMALPAGARDNTMLLPFAEEFVRKLDLPARRIEMELPAGLLDVDGPLSDEEKQRQKAEAGEARRAGGRRRRDQAGKAGQRRSGR